MVFRPPSRQTLDFRPQTARDFLCFDLTKAWDFWFFDPHKRQTFGFLIAKSARLLVFRPQRAPFWFFDAQKRRIYDFRRPTASDLYMVFRLPKAPGLLFFDARKRWTYGCSTPKSAGLMVFRLTTALDLLFWPPNSARTFFICGDPMLIFFMWRPYDQCFFFLWWPDDHFFFW